EHPPVNRDHPLRQPLLAENVNEEDYAALFALVPDFVEVGVVEKNIFALLPVVFFTTNKDVTVALLGNHESEVVAENRLEEAVVRRNVLSAFNNTEHCHAYTGKLAKQLCCFGN